MIRRASRLLWGVALLTLPVTSFRYFPFVGETTYVRPLAAYPVALLLVLLGVEWLRGARKFPWSASTILLACFAAAALAATAMGATLAPLPLRGQEYADRALRAIVTLVLGLMFFLAAAGMSREQADVRFTGRWLLAGFAVTLLWSGLQAVTFYTGLLEKETVTHWQLAFSMRELVRTNRLSGLAYEPAWLAAQIATVYAPVLLGALLTGQRLGRSAWLGRTLLSLAYVVVLATYSRGGVAITLLSASLTLVAFGREAVRKLLQWFREGLRGGLEPLLPRALAGVLLVGVVAGSFAFLSQRNYFRRLWEIRADSVREYLLDINAGARNAYAVGAMAAFHHSPLSGAGLGASGLYIYDNLPDWSLTYVPEIARQLSPASRLYPNPKNMYVRVLAETGLVGLMLYLLFMASVLADSLQHALRRQPDRLVAIAGFTSWVAILLWNLTQDSLAVPNIWLIPGVLAGLSADAGRVDA